MEHDDMCLGSQIGLHKAATAVADEQSDCVGVLLAEGVVAALRGRLAQREQRREFEEVNRRRRSL